MKEIVFIPKQERVTLDSIDRHEPIFAKRDGKLAGMVVKEDEGWILRIGGSIGSYGHHTELEDCLETSLQFGYTYFVED